MPALTDPFSIGPVRVDNRVVLAPLAGIGNWFVRLQAKRHGAGLARLGDGLELRDPLPQREDAARAAAHPPRRAAPVVASSCSARTPRSCARPPSTVAERGARPDRPQHGLPGPQGLQDRRGRGAARRPGPRGRGRARGARGQRPAGHGQAAQRPRPGDDRAASSSPAGSSTRPASPAIGFHPRSAAVHHKGTPDYALAARARRRAARAGDPLRRPARRATRSARPSSTPARPR